MSADNPCIGICEIDESGYCVGCGRSADEIFGETDSAPDGEEAVLLDGVLLRRILVVGGLLLAAAFGLYEWEMAHGASAAAALACAGCMSRTIAALQYPTSGRCSGA